MNAILSVSKSRLSARSNLFVGKHLFVLLLSLITMATEGNTNKLLQFTAGEHVIAFLPECLYMTGSDHMLKVTFQNANVVTPEAEHYQPQESNAQPLEKVIYPELWNGIDLTYEHKVSSIAKSTYTVSPGSDAGQIRLLYNVQVRLDKTGKLLFGFEKGELSETAPIAWQIIKGERSEVDVEFCRRGEKMIGFRVGEYNPDYQLIIDPEWEWNTFTGSSSGVRGRSIAVDGKGNVYVAGYGGSWGSPVNEHAGWVDAFAAKFSSSGVLQWHTYMGGPEYDDFGIGIAVDGSGNVYVAGESDATWGSPVNAYAGGFYDAFAAKLDSNGVRQWNTFIGSSTDDRGKSIAVDGSGNVYVAGYGKATWGSPVTAYAGKNDAFAVKLDSSGVLQWNTFMGSSDWDEGRSIAVDGSGNVYIAGMSTATWSSPVNAYAGGFYDGFAAKLDSDGVLQWNTFMGGQNTDESNGIALDGSGNVYVTGFSESTTWGSPVNAHSGGFSDAFAAKLDNNGVRQWNTFMGSADSDAGNGIAVDGSGNVYIAGDSKLTWGSPQNGHTGDEYGDAFAARLNNSGMLQWSTFMGGTSWDYGKSITVDNKGIVYVSGTTYIYAWGTPVTDHAGWGYDAFAVKFDYAEIVSVEEESGLPAAVELAQNYPNPFTDITVIKYVLPGANHVSLKVYNIQGEKIKTLVDQFQAQGNYEITFDASQLSGGIYFYELNTGHSATVMKKMTVIK
jgi:hypothetical protein